MQLFPDVLGLWRLITYRVMFRYGRTKCENAMVVYCTARDLRNILVQSLPEEGTWPLYLWTVIA